MPTPQPSSSNSFPKFPEHVICGIAKEFVDLYAPIRETPPQFLWLAFITYLGNSISKLVQLHIANSEPRVFGVAIGRSARTKKSTGNNLARNFFRSVMGDSQLVLEGFGSSEGLLTALAQHPGSPLLVHLDEINILAQKTNVDGSVGISAFNKLFEDNDYDHILSQRGSKVRDAHLSLLGASTLDDFLKTWTGKHADAGFFSRLFFVGADPTAKRISSPVPPNPVKHQALLNETKQVLANLEAASKAIHAPVQYHLDVDAAKVWDSFYNSFGDGKEWDRVDTYGFRLMVIQAVLKGQRTVTREIVEEIIDVLRYEVAVRRIVKPVIAHNKVAELEQMIMLNLPASGQPIKYRALYRKVHAERHGPILFKQALRSLADDGQLTIVPTNTAKSQPSYARVLDPDDDTELVTEKLVTAKAIDKSAVAPAEVLLSPVTMASHAHSSEIQPSA